MCGQNAEFVNIELGGTHTSNHWASEGCYMNSYMLFGVGVRVGVSSAGRIEC